MAGPVVGVRASYLIFPQSQGRGLAQRTFQNGRGVQQPWQNQTGGVSNVHLGPTYHRRHVRRSVPHVVRPVDCHGAGRPLARRRRPPGDRLQCVGHRLRRRGGGRPANSPPERSPDGRPGAALLFFGFSADAVAKATTNRTGQCLMTCPTTAVYDGLPDASRARSPRKDTPLLRRRVSEKQAHRLASLLANPRDGRRISGGRDRSARRRGWPAGIFSFRPSTNRGPLPRRGRRSRPLTWYPA